MTQPTNINEFSADLDKFAQQLGLGIQQVVVRTGLEVFKRVVAKTPVDTGRARASWNFSKDAPDPTVKPPGEYAAPATPSAPGAIPGEYPVIYISNNLDYILHLEQGRSQQAPGGMVGLTLAEVELWLRVQMGALHG